MSRFAAIAIPPLLVITLCACAGNHDDTTPRDGPQPAPRASRFQDCSQLQQYLAEVATRQLELEQLYMQFAPPPELAVGGEADAVAGGREFTGTNIQEQGVDETDFVKTDGEYLYLLSGGQFLIFDAWPATSTAELSRTAVDGQPLGLFVRGNVAATLTQFWQYEITEGFLPRGAARVDVQLFDLSDRTAPALLRELSLEGSFSAGRLVGDQMALVLHTELPIYAPQPLPPEAGSPAAAAPTRWDQLDIEELIPAYTDTLFGGAGPETVTGTLCACENFYRPGIPNGTGIVTLVSLDLADPTAEFTEVALASNGGVVYGSQDSIYLATRNDNPWFWLPLEDGAEPRVPEATTVVHRFSLGEKPTYQASGMVPGWVLNAYSMGEHRGTLRIATTTDNWWQDREPANAVYTFQQSGESLLQVGALTGLGKAGERIYAVRFLGDRGYVVTFLQTDPLYALDLSDPTRPDVVGELEVPGFSTYLHPVGDTHLIAVGQHTSPWGVELSLFDVRDPAAPALVDREFLGEGSYSEAQYEPKAFTYFDTAGVLAIPAVTWNARPDDARFSGDEVFAGARVYDVGPDTGFHLRGEVDHTGFYEPPQGGFWFYPEPIRRSFFIQDTEEGPFLYTVSRRGLQVNALDDLASALATHPLPAEEVYWLDVPIRGN